MILHSILLLNVLESVATQKRQCPGICGYTIEAVSWNLLLHKRGSVLESVATQKRQLLILGWSTTAS